MYKISKNCFKVEMNEKYNKLKDILGPEKFTDEEFPIKSTENNPWLKGAKKWNEEGNLVSKTQDDLQFDRPVYGKFLQDSHSAQDILQGQIGMNSFNQKSRIHDSNSRGLLVFGCRSSCCRRTTSN